MRCPPQHTAINKYRRDNSKQTQHKHREGEGGRGDMELALSDVRSGHPIHADSEGGPSKSKMNFRFF